MITKEDLEKRGYRWWDNRNRHKIHPHSDGFYQKKFQDENGIKYFICMVHYSEIAYEGQTLPESWMVELNNNSPHFTFQWHRPGSIDEAEAKCETFFRTMGCEYYERHQ